MARTVDAEIVRYLTAGARTAIDASGAVFEPILSEQLRKLFVNAALPVRPLFDPQLSCAASSLDS